MEILPKIKIEMNIFIECIKKGKISSITDLKKLFWKLAKKLHPDVSSVEGNQKKFIKMKSDFDFALKHYKEIANIEHTEITISNFNYCKELFCDLIASNFPVDLSIRNKNKAYLDRISRLNSTINLFGNEFIDLFLKVEKELYLIRGTTTIANHVFNLIKLLFYRISDYYYNGNSFAKKYIKVSYYILIDVLKAKNALNMVFFLKWLVREII